MKILTPGRAGNLAHLGRLAHPRAGVALRHGVVMLHRAGGQERKRDQGQQHELFHFECPFLFPDNEDRKAEYYTRWDRTVIRGSPQKYSESRTTQYLRTTASGALICKRPPPHWVRISFRLSVP